MMDCLPGCLTSCCSPVCGMPTAKPQRHSCLRPKASGGLPDGRETFPERDKACPSARKWEEAFPRERLSQKKEIFPKKIMGSTLRGTGGCLPERKETVPETDQAFPSQRKGRTSRNTDLPRRDKGFTSDRKWRLPSREKGERWASREKGDTPDRKIFPRGIRGS